MGEPLMKHQPKEVLTPEELANRLGMHVGSLANWRVVGKGPKFFQSGKGGRVRYRRDAVEAWEKRKERAST